jgi:hypothetical protein
MANDPKKKTESAADAPQSSGTAGVSANSGAAPTPRELELQAQIEDLRGEVEFLRQERGPDLNDAKLHALIERLGESIGAGVAKAIAAERESHRPGNHKKQPKREVPAEFKGPRTYIVGPKKAFQNGRLFQPGEKITVVDQFPASDWTPVEDAKSAPVQSAPAKQGRASDQTVG